MGFLRAQLRWAITTVQPALCLSRSKSSWGRSYKKQCLNAAGP